MFQVLYICASSIYENPTVTLLDSSGGMPWCVSSYGWLFLQGGKLRLLEYIALSLNGRLRNGSPGRSVLFFGSAQELIKLCCPSEFSVHISAFKKSRCVAAAGVIQAPAGYQCTKSRVSWRDSHAHLLAWRNPTFFQHDRASHGSTGTWVPLQKPALVQLRMSFRKFLEN